MVSARRRNWSLDGYTVFWTLFMAGCLLTILFSKFSIDLSKGGLSSTIAPQVLSLAPESFRLSLRVEAPDVAVEEITKTKAWADLQESVSAYTQRLELMERQRRMLSWGVFAAYIASAIGMLVTVPRSKKTGKAGGLLSPSAVGDRS